MHISDAARVFRFTDWSALMSAGTDTTFTVMVDGEAVIAKVVEVIDKEDYDNDRNLSVTVEVAGQFFQKTGYAQVGSHCYGDYEPLWYDLKEVRPRQKVVTLYEDINSF